MGDDLYRLIYCSRAGVGAVAELERIGPAIAARYAGTGVTGALLFNINAFNKIGFTLPVAGTYTVVVYGSAAATGGYSLQLEDIDAAPTAALGTTVTGTLCIPTCGGALAAISREAAR